MASWQLQEAKAKFSEVIAMAEKKGPQIITRRGVDTAVLVPISEWKKLETQKHNVAKEGRTERQKSEDLLALLRSAPDFEIPDRHRERLERRKEERLTTRATLKTNVSA